jgi:aspartate carbamoyltransferase catalytic subunit
MQNLRHLTRTTQIERAWLDSDFLPLCDRLQGSSEPEPVLKGQSLYCLFYEPSFLTRTSFERAMGLLGGQAYHTEDAPQSFPVRTPNYVDNIITILASLQINLVVLRSSDIGVVETAERTDALPVINGGSGDDHPTQALADIYTMHRELGGVDGVKIALVGRLEHRNVSALLRGLALFENVKVTLIPFSGQVDPDVAAYCEGKGMELVTGPGIEAVEDMDVIYLNGPRTLAHVQLLKSRDSFHLRIDKEFMERLQSHTLVLDPMQRSGDFEIDVQDSRLAYYRQAGNSLIVRMAVLHQALAT